MKPEARALELLSETRSKAKMYEYDVPESHHILLTRDPARLFSLAIGLLGDVSARIVEDPEWDCTKLGAESSELLSFAADFFGSYPEAILDQPVEDYPLLLGSAAYYLCGLPGSSQVLAERVRDLEMQCGGLDRLLHWLLVGRFGRPLAIEEGRHRADATRVSEAVSAWYSLQGEIPAFWGPAMAIREKAYFAGSARELLLADVIVAILKTRYACSARRCLPSYSGLPLDVWRPALAKKSFMQELWPAQRLLGIRGILSGASAVVQMPTSAGKTRAADLVIRSAFLSGRAETAAVVAPFRALCAEIRSSLAKSYHGEGVVIEEFSDVMQLDYAADTPRGLHRILVLTPEKLVYVLRHSPDVAGGLGLLIYDEAHQFDSGSRGVTYELLATSLRALSKKDMQTVLFSAVVGNAPELGQWLFGEPNAVVPDRDLTPTKRNVAFASWRDLMGRLEFVREDRTDQEEFFVPRVIVANRLERIGHERLEHWFPDRDDGQSVALYLALKLAGKGSVAVFCGRRDAVESIASRAADVYRRGLPLAKPVDFSDASELGHLERLYVRNLGANATLSRAASLGILSHHGNVPHGIRLAVEHAMKAGLGRVVLCTSTLAQGVNMPLRYLIVTSVFQGGERMTARDFQNLAGRAGRSGMHTEGTVLFADPEVYDKRRSESWRWRLVQRLLKRQRTEPCGSSLLAVLEPLWAEHRRVTIAWDPLGFVEAYLRSGTAADRYLDELLSAHSEEGLTRDSLHRQVEERMEVVAALENFIMANARLVSDETTVDEVLELVRATFAFHLARQEEQQSLDRLFILVANNVRARVPEPARRAAFAKTLYGVTDALAVEEWVASKRQELALCETAEECLGMLWPLLRTLIRNRTFQNCDTPEVLLTLARGWIDGKPYSDLLTFLSASNCRFGRRHPTIDHVVEVCDHALSYDGSLAVGAVAEVYSGMFRGDAAPVSRLHALQRNLKCGLSDRTSVLLYEVGFRDRVLARDLAPFVGGVHDREATVAVLREKRADLKTLLADTYPSYFVGILDELIS